MQSCLCSKPLLNAGCCSSGARQLGAWISIFERHCYFKMSGNDHPVSYPSRMESSTTQLLKFQNSCHWIVQYTNLKMYAWHPFHLTLSNTAKYMTNSVYKNVCSILPCNFYMKCFNPINYFVNFGMDTQTRKFIQCHLTGAFTKLWKAPVSFAMPAYLSICMNEFCYHWKDFCEIILQTFSKNCQENSSLVKIRQIYQHFTWRSKYIL